MGVGVARGHACPAFAKETNGSFLFFSFSPGGERQRNFSQTEKRGRVLRRLGCVPFSLHSAVMSYTLTRGAENAGVTPRDSAGRRVSLVSRPFCRFLASLLLLFFFPTSRVELSRGCGSVSGSASQDFVQISVQRQTSSGLGGPGRSTLLGLYSAVCAPNKEAFGEQKEKKNCQRL